MRCAARHHARTDEPRNCERPWTQGTGDQEHPLDHLREVSRAEPARTDDLCGAAQSAVALTKVYRRGPWSLLEVDGRALHYRGPLTTFADGPFIFSPERNLTSKFWIAPDPSRERCACGASRCLVQPKRCLS